LRRGYGVLLLLVYGAELFFKKKDRVDLKKELSLMPIAFIGISAFCIYQYSTFNNPILFFYAQVAWGHDSYNNLIQY